MATGELGLTNTFASGDAYPHGQANDVADDLDTAYKNHLTAGISVAAQAGDVIAVTVQAKTLGGNNVATETPLEARLVSSNSKTAALTGTAPSGGWAAGVGLLERTYTTNKDAAWITNASGSLRIDITEVGAATWYLVVKIGPRLFISSAITFV